MIDDNFLVEDTVTIFQGEQIYSVRELVHRNFYVEILLEGLRENKIPDYVIERSHAFTDGFFEGDVQHIGGWIRIKSGVEVGISDSGTRGVPREIEPLVVQVVVRIESDGNPVCIVRVWSRKFVAGEYIQ